MKSTRVSLIVGILLLGVGVTVAVAWVISQDKSGSSETANNTTVTLTPTTIMTLPPFEFEWAALEAGAVYEHYLLAYPGPDSTMSLTDYHRGIGQGLLRDPSKSFNICIYTETLRGGDNRVCGPPPGSINTPDPNCRTLAHLQDTDFRPYIQLFLDGEMISGGKLGAENTAEIRSAIEADALLMCYRVALGSGAHMMRYVFEYEPENIMNINEWSFTLTP